MTTNSQNLQRSRSSFLVLNPKFMRSSASTANQPPNRKAMLLNPNNPQTLVSTSFLKNIDSFSPRDKKPSMTMVPMSFKKSLTFQNFIDSSSPSARQEALRKKQEEWENFKKNPRFSFLQSQSEIDQVSNEQLLEVFFLYNFGKMRF